MKEGRRVRRQRSPRCPKFLATMWCQSREKGFLQLVTDMDRFWRWWSRRQLFQSRRLTLGGRLSPLRLPLESVDYSERSIQLRGISKGRRFRARRWFVDLDIINSTSSSVDLSYAEGVWLVDGSFLSFRYVEVLC